VSSPSLPQGVLLDTCALLWFATESKLRESALKAIFNAALHQGIFISTVSAWEIGMIAKRKSPQFLLDPKAWFEDFMAKDGIRPAPLTSAIAIDSIYLPEPLHGDPGDRLLIATARHLGFPMGTRDRKIEAYADLGHVGVILC
jgi:PIN domain nuclease of toxin-antitoxin system